MVARRGENKPSTRDVEEPPSQMSQPVGGVTLLLLRICGERNLGLRTERV